MRLTQKLVVAGWLLQDMKQIELSAGGDVVVREYPTDTCPADYVLFVQRRAAGVIHHRRPDRTLCRCLAEIAKRQRAVAFPD